MRIMRGDSTSERLARMPGNSGAQKAQPLAHRYSALEQEGTNLIDEAGALPDQALAHSVQRLQVKLVGRLGGDKLHGRALHCLGNRFGVAEIIFLPFAICARTYFAGISRAS
jgi:hypothetical protein